VQLWGITGTQVSTTSIAERIEETSQLSHPSPWSPSLWNAIADLAVFSMWVLVSTFTLLHHEKWADEAQSWLLARDLDLHTLWFKELRYEGSPGLWHTMLWVAQHWFHAPYAAIGPIGLLCATAGVALMLWHAPFPRPLRYLLAFSYFIIYQYAVIARPYVVFPLLAFAAAILFKDYKHPERMTIVLALLANLSVHGALIAACIGLAYLWQGVRNKNILGDRVRGRYVLSAVAMLLVFLFLFAILNPPANVEALQSVQQRTLSTVGFAICEGINGAFFDFTPLTLAWLTLGGVWCFLRKGEKALLPPTLILTLGMFYGFYGLPHHQGTILIAAITGLWIAWPTTEEKNTLSPHARWVHQALVIGMACLLGYQVWNASVVIRNDYRYPYSGAEDAAKYLKSVGADQRPIMGLSYGMVAVEAYFDHNIQDNRPTSYFHHGKPYAGLSIDQTYLQMNAPDYVVLSCWSDCDALFQDEYDPYMRSNGYALAHFSDGHLFSKRDWFIRQAYFIYHRSQGTAFHY
jgi:hypothetical protein